MIRPEELRHVKDGPRPHEQPAGAGTVTVTASTSGPDGVLARCAEVMTAVLTATTPPWPSRETWAAALPPWFVRRCAPESTPEQDADWLAWWRGLDADRRLVEARTKPWSLSDWLHRLRPDERTWYWWSSRVDGSGAARIEVQVAGWPVPLGSLEWLLKACGADDVGLPEDA